MPLAGDPDVLLTSAEQLADAARALGAAHDEMVARARSIAVDWTGPAAPPTVARLEGDAEAVRRTADAVASLVGPLRTYSDELRAAQREFDLGEQQRAQPVTAAEGFAAMTAAAERALRANGTAARAFDAALTAPATAAAGGGSGLGAALAEGGNLAASLGSAALHHPASTFAVAGGGVLATLSAAGVLGGTAATATGVGSPLGVPLTGASIAGVTAGVGLAGAGAVDLTQHALGDDRVAPFRVDTDAGGLPFDPPGGISGMTEHGRQRAEGRDGVGVSDEAMADAVANPTVPPEPQTNGTYRYEGRDAVVSLNERGEVVTTWARTSNGWRNR